MHLQIWFLLLIIPTLMAGTTGHNYDDDVNSYHSYSDEYGDNFANMFGSVGTITLTCPRWQKVLLNKLHWGIL